MVRFGKTLEEQRVPEWASGYVDYKGLKKTLASMIASGSIQKFNEITVYSPISVATTEVVLAPPGPGELEFMAEVDAEIEKVNSFTLKLKEDPSELEVTGSRSWAERDAELRKRAIDVDQAGPSTATMGIKKESKIARK